MTDSLVIEFSDFEPSKENIQPNRAGRSAAAIIEAIKKPRISEEENNAATAAKRAELEAAIKNYKGDNPLAPWLNYIQWTQQSYLNNSNNKSMLLSLLEKCTRHFKDKEEYKQKRQYVSIWLLYANHVDKPDDIYMYCYSNHVGTQLSIFYECWSDYIISSTKNYKKAKEILDYALAMQAQPISNIKHAMNRLNAKLERLEAEKQRLQESNELTPDLVRSAMFDESQPRRALTSLRSTATATVATANQAAQASRPLAPSNSINSNTNQLNFQIFSDAPSIPQQNSLFPSLTNENINNGGNNLWRDLSSRESAGKENQGLITTWNQPLNSNSSTSSATRSADSTDASLAASQPQYAWASSSSSNSATVAANPSTNSSAIDIYVEPECEENYHCAQQRAEEKLSQQSQVRAQLDGKSKVLSDSTVASNNIAKLIANPLRNIQKSEKKAESSHQPPPQPKTSNKIADSGSNNISAREAEENKSHSTLAAQPKLSLKDKLTQRHAAKLQRNSSSNNNTNIASDSSSAATGNPAPHSSSGQFQIFSDFQ
jgi:hypothetical protein